MATPLSAGMSQTCESELSGDIEKMLDRAERPRPDRVADFERRAYERTRGKVDDPDAYHGTWDQCPLTFSKDANNDPVGPWYPMAAAEADALERAEPHLVAGNRATIGNKKMKVFNKRGQRCVTARGKYGNRQRLGNLVENLEQLAQSFSRDVSNPMRASTRAMQQRWMDETADYVRAVKNADLEAKYGADAMFMPSSDVGCDPQGQDPALQEKWKRKVGPTRKPTSDVKPTVYENEEAQWYRPMAVRVGDQVRCVGEDWRNRQGKTAAQAYPKTYHDFDGLRAHTKRGGKTRMQLYQEAMKCAQALDEPSCTKDPNDNPDAPLGGKLAASATCRWETDPVDNSGAKCVPKRYKNKNKRDKGYARWYDRFHQAEKEIMTDNPWVKAQMSVNPELVTARRLFPRGAGVPPFSGGGPVEPDYGASDYSSEYSDLATMSTA